MGVRPLTTSIGGICRVWAATPDPILSGTFVTDRLQPSLLWLKTSYCSMYIPFSSARPPRLIDPLGLKCESGCDDCPGGFWLGGGVKGDAMASVGIGIGGNIGLVRVFCTSSSLSCDLVVVCLKVIGAGGSAGVTFTGGFTGNTKCAEDLESVTVGVDLDGGGGLYASGGIQSAPGRSLKKSGFGGQIEVGIGFGLSGGLAICKAIRIGCR